MYSPSLTPQGSEPMPGVEKDYTPSTVKKTQHNQLPRSGLLEQEHPRYGVPPPVMPDAVQEEKKL
jgi:hypothetical protein